MLSLYLYSIFTNKFKGKRCLFFQFRKCGILLALLTGGSTYIHREESSVFNNMQTVTSLQIFIYYSGS